VGEQQESRRLTLSEVRYIFSAKRAGQLQKEIAEVLGVSLTTVLRVLVSEWRHMAENEMTLENRNG